MKNDYFDRFANYDKTVSQNIKVAFLKK